MGLLQKAQEQKKIQQQETIETVTYKTKTTN